MSDSTKVTYYKIDINAPATNDSGFIDAKKYNEYADFNGNGTALEYKNKVMGYLRWFNLNLMLNKGGLFYVDKISMPNSTSVVTPTSISFTVGYNQIDNLTALKDVDGVETMFYEEDALAIIIENFLTSPFRGLVEYFMPSNSTSVPNQFTPELCIAPALYTKPVSASVYTITEVFKNYV